MTSQPIDPRTARLRLRHGGTVDAETLGPHRYRIECACGSTFEAYRPTDAPVVTCAACGTPITLETS